MTDTLRDRITAVERALAIYRTGDDDRGYTELVERPKLQLADALLEAVVEQTAAREAQIDAVPTRQVIAALAKRRRRA